ncbi:MAG: hypothetical protein ABJO57_14920 [Lentilitoribacter sp.]
MKYFPATFTIVFCLFCSSAYAQSLTLILDFSDEDVQTYSVDWHPGMTIENVLQEGVPDKGQGAEFVANWYNSFNSYLISEILGISNSGQMTWLYCVGNNLMPLGINNVLATPNTDVTFRYIDSQTVDFSKIACPTR